MSIDPLHGWLYQFFSGPGADLGMLAAITVYLRRHNCHVRRCPRLSWHPDANGHPVCRWHHADHS